MEHRISQELLNVTIQYLAKRPYDEVFQLIPALQGCVELEQIEKEGEK